MKPKERRSLPKNLWLVASLFVIVIAAFIGMASAKPATGEAIPIMPNTYHIPEGTDPNPYNSNPPSSGIHYPIDLKPGFYEENIYQYPEGYLVHNLEHGYVIFWYNCSLLSAQDCENLKTSIKDVMAESKAVKLIAYPWDKTSVPLAMTSWGRLFNMPQFDRKTALDFIHRNLNQAPEPNAD
jgi:hypothetical protein